MVQLRAADALDKHDSYDTQHRSAMVTPDSEEGPSESGRDKDMARSRVQSSAGGSEFTPSAFGDLFAGGLPGAGGMPGLPVLPPLGGPLELPGPWTTPDIPASVISGGRFNPGVGTLTAGYPTPAGITARVVVPRPQTPSLPAANAPRSLRLPEAGSPEVSASSANEVRDMEGESSRNPHHFVLTPV